MARTNPKARRGSEGHALGEERKERLGELGTKDKHHHEAAERDEMGAGRQNNGENKQAKRPREAIRTSEISTADSSLPSAKKLKKDDSVTAAASGPSRDTSKVTPKLHSSNAPAIPADLQSRYEVTTMSILSSSKIQKKVTRILELLATDPAPPTKPSVIMLYSKAISASKAVSVAEIARRELAKAGGKWFQYIQVESTLEVQEKKKPAKASSGDNKNKKEDLIDSMNENDEDMDETFETMKTPFERAIEGQPKLRAVPTMSIYLSRVRVESLKKSFGEQSNT